MSDADVARTVFELFLAQDAGAASARLAVDGGPVPVRYEYSVADGTRYRNMEVLTVRDGRVAGVEVYFGLPFEANRNREARSVVICGK